MYQFHVKYIFYFFLFLVTGIKAFAQTSTVSNPTSTRENNPYSRFGVGENLNGNNTVLQGMGNISSAYENPYTINSDNPASYSFLRFTTYEAGVKASVRTVGAGGTNYSTGTTTIEYMNIGIPVSKHGGICFGFRPATRVYYNLADTAVYSGIGSVRRTYAGTGGLNYAYFGAAYQYKGLSLGANLGYMFGSITNSSFLNDIDTTVALNSDFSKYSRIGGVYWKMGVLYETNLNKDYLIRLGGTLTLSQKLNLTQNNYALGTLQSSDSSVHDTAYQTSQTTGKVTMPMTYSLGVHIVKVDNWDLGIDYTATNWSQFRGINPSSDTFAATSYRISVGGEITPNPSNIRNFWSRVTYRFGLYYGQDPIYLQSTPLNCYGLTAGLSLPFKRTTSEVHGALEIGRMGTQSKGLVEESYIRLTLGLTFNAKWFIPRKYE